MQWSFWYTEMTFVMHSGKLSLQQEWVAETRDKMRGERIDKDRDRAYTCRTNVL
jgi:hypothetical protein